MCSCFKSNGPSLFLGVWGLKGTILVAVNLIEENIFDWTIEETQTLKKGNKDKQLLQLSISQNISKQEIESQSESFARKHKLRDLLVCYRAICDGSHIPFQQPSPSFYKHNSFIIGRSLAGEAWNQQSANGSSEAYHETKSKWPGY